MTATGSVVLSLAVALFGVGAFTIYGIAKDPSAHLNGLKQQLNTTSTGPDASFGWTSQGYTVAFRDTSTDTGSTITSWVWEFGDGTGYTGATPPAHTYTATCPMCTENVTLGVTDAAGHQSVATASVVIQQFGGSSGVGQSPQSQVELPGFLGTASQLAAATELLFIMFLIAGSVALAGWRLLRREPETIQVPVRERGARD